VLEVEESLPNRFGTLKRWVFTGETLEWPRPACRPLPLVSIWWGIGVGHAERRG
jgi:hypothetical protein